MHLLYCDVNGTVISVHDDSDTAVPMSAYPTVVRIIPYDQPLVTLNRVGPAPPATTMRPPPLDTRLYAQPKETSHILMLYAAQVRFNVINAGFSFPAAAETIPVATDRMSYMMVSNTAQYAATLPPSALIDFTQGSDRYRVTAAEIQAIFVQFSDLIQKARTAQANCMDDLNSATPTLLTYTDIDEAFASV